MDGGLTEYERQREEKIRQNEEMLKKMGIQTLMASIAPPKAVSLPKRGLSAKRKRLSSDALPQRRSSRLQGEEADGGEIDAELRNGTVVVIAGGGGGAGKQSESSEPRERHPKGDIPFRSSNTSVRNDQAFLHSLRVADGKQQTAAAVAGPSSSVKSLRGGKGASSKNAKKQAKLSLEETYQLALKEDDWRKVTRDGITHLSFMPVSSALILAAADKKGNIGIYNVDYKGSESEKRTPAGSTADKAAVGGVLSGASDHLSPDTMSPPAPRRRSRNAADNSNGDDDAELKDEDGVVFEENSDDDDDDDDSSFDGVLSFTIHHQYISGLKWAGTGARAGSSNHSLFTCSYDGSIRRLDLTRGVFELAWGDEEMEYSCFDVSPDGNIAYVGDKDGDLDVIDLRTQTRVHKTLPLHDKKLNTVQLDPTSGGGGGGGHLLVTSSTDTRVRLWDVRKFNAQHPKAALLSTANHNKTCQAAYLAPDGSQRVVSTSFDDTIRIWDGKKDLAPLVRIKQNTQTGRWTLPLRAVWSSASDAVIVGSTHRTVNVYDAETGKLAKELMSSEYMTAIAPRNCVHPTMNVIASGTGSGRGFIYR